MINGSSGFLDKKEGGIIPHLHDASTETSHRSFHELLPNASRVGARCAPTLDLLRTAGWDGVSGDGFLNHARRCFAVGDRRLAKTTSDLVQTTQIDIRQIGVALPDVVDRLVHPVPLIFFSSLQDPATVHMAEKLIPCPLQ